MSDLDVRPERYRRLGGVGRGGGRTGSARLLATGERDLSVLGTDPGGYRGEAARRLARADVSEFDPGSGGATLRIETGSGR